MAKRARMGRNLDALLGGASRERVSSATAGPDTSAAAKVPEDPVTPVSDSDNTTAPQVAEKSTPEATPVSVAQGSASPAEAETTETDTADRLQVIGVSKIRRGTYQPRRLFDQELLQELADSIKEQGMIQPVLVRRFAGAFELVAGERRWRAAKLAGLTEIPAIVREMADQSVAAVAIIENIQRKDLNPLEEAAAFERLCDEFGMTHKAVADSVGRSRASVSNLLRLLELHDEVKLLVDKGELDMGHARAILGAPQDKQLAIARQAIEKGLTVRAVEKLVRELDEEKPTPAADKQSNTDPDIERLSQKLGETLGAAVRIQHRPTGAGKLEVSYSSVAELQGILAHIK